MFSYVGIPEVNLCKLVYSLPSNSEKTIFPQYINNKRFADQSRVHGFILSMAANSLINKFSSTAAYNWFITEKGNKTNYANVKRQREPA